MSSPWKSRLRRFLKEKARGRLVLVGVGNALRGDDGAGSLLAARLRKVGRSHLIDAGAAPENYCERIARLSPDTVLVVDAARFGGSPGEVKILTPGDIAAGALSTHDASLRIMAGYLKERCGSEMFILGMEPGDAAVGAELSPQMKETMGILESLFLEILPPGSSLACPG